MDSFIKTDTFLSQSLSQNKGKVIEIQLFLDPLLVICITIRSQHPSSYDIKLTHSEVGVLIWNQLIQCFPLQSPGETATRLLIERKPRSLIGQ